MLDTAHSSMQWGRKQSALAFKPCRHRQKSTSATPARAKASMWVSTRGNHRRSEGAAFCSSCLCDCYACPVLSTHLRHNSPAASVEGAAVSVAVDKDLTGRLSGRLRALSWPVTFQKALHRIFARPFPQMPCMIHAVL